MIELRIEGPPHGKGRPRFSRGRTYTDHGTQLAEARVERAWEAAGQQRLDGPITLEVLVVVTRPQAHYKRDGLLSAAGQREPWPRRKPDLDNVIKLIADALNAKAFRDDADIVHTWAVRRWANPGETDHTLVRVRPMAVLHGAEARAA